MQATKLIFKTIWNFWLEICDSNALAVDFVWVAYLNQEGILFWYYHLLYLFKLVIQDLRSCMWHIDAIPW